MKNTLRQMPEGKYFEKLLQAFLNSDSQINSHTDYVVYRWFLHSITPEVTKTAPPNTEMIMAPSDTAKK